jgi:hypothetical protein
MDFKVVGIHNYLSYLILADIHAYA